MGPTRCTPIAWSYMGQKGAQGGMLQPNNGDNIASARQSLGMLSRNFRPCGRQRTP